MTDQVSPKSVRLPPHGTGHESTFTEETFGFPGALPFNRRGDPNEVRSRLPPVRAYQPGAERTPQAIAGDLFPPPAEVPSKKKNPKNPKAPAWLQGTYHPRALTSAGLFALDLLAPDGIGAMGYPRTPIPTMEDHRDMLAFRYTCWDMIRLGHAFEVCGHYFNHRKIGEIEELKQKARRSFTGQDPLLGGGGILQWLAISGMMTWDQLLTTDPEHCISNLGILNDLEEEGLVCRRRIGFGLGSLEVWMLSRNGRRHLEKSTKDVKKWDFCRPNTLQIETAAVQSEFDQGLAALHPLLTVDAILWFRQQALHLGANPEALMLEAGLLRELKSEKGMRRPDFVIDTSIGTWSIEVIGVGSSYRSLARMKEPYKKPYYRTFSSADNKVCLGHHVVIGR